MRLFKLAALAAVFISFSISPAFGADDDGVDWLNNYKQALEEAKRTGKPIFLEHRCEP